MLTQPSGEVRVKLGNVAFAPKFQTSVVSFRRLLSKGIHWDTQGSILKADGKLWCQVFHKYDQFVLEYNPVTTFPVNSRASKPALKGTIERWYL